MSTSIKLVLRKSKTRADGTAPIYLRATADRKSRFTSTGVYVEPKFWNDRRQEIRASHEIADALNAKLKQKLSEGQVLALDAPSAAAVKAGLDGSGGSMTAYFERFVSDLNESGKFWERRKYQTTLTKLRACLGTDIMWGEVDQAALRKFERYLRQVRKNNPNTTRKELTRLGRVFKQAIRDGEIEPSADPFLVYQKPPAQRVERRKLALEEIDALAALGEDEGLAPGTFDEVTRDCFVFAFYAGGMRFSDVCQLKATNLKDGRVNYRMMKTGTPMSVPLPLPAVTIAGKYAGNPEQSGGFLFPLLRAGDDRDGVHLRKRISSVNVRANTALKRLASMADIEPEGLSTHVARHSFADYARRHSGDLYAISKSLGHGNLQTTEIYLKSFDRDAVDSLASQLWNNADA